MWVAALINPYGTPAQVIEAVMADRITAVLTQQLLDELSAATGAPIVTGDADLLTADLKPAAISPRRLLEQLGDQLD